MKIFGHPWLESEKFYRVSSIEEIEKSPVDSLLIFKSLEESLLLVKYCQKNSLACILEIGSIKEAIFANNFHIKFVLCDKKLAKKLMPIAQNYLFDTQILAYIKDEDEIEELAEFGIDGVLLIDSQ